MNNEDGRVLSAPGSREPSPDGLGPSGFDPSRENATEMVALTEVYPNLRVPVPGKGEWLDFFIADAQSRYSLYWRLNDGPRDDPDTVEFGFISSHKGIQHVQSKAAWLVQAQRMLGLAA